MTWKRSGCKGLHPDPGSADAGLCGGVHLWGQASSATESPYHLGCLEGEAALADVERHLGVYVIAARDDRVLAVRA